MSLMACDGPKPSRDPPVAPYGQDGPKFGHKT